MSLLIRYVRDFINLLFPYVCSACKRELFEGEKSICTSCLYDLPFTDFHLYADHAAARLFWGRVQCNGVMAMLYFRKGNSVQQIIHSLKYKGQTELGFVLGKMLGERLKLAAGYQEADLIIPVPLHPKKQRSRGYNQSQCIAEGISAVLHIPVNTTQLLRNRYTVTQTRRTRFSRFENMKSVFIVAEPEVLAGKHILLVDDVITTGSTLESCSEVLLNCRISKLSICAIAYAE